MTPVFRNGPKAEPTSSPPPSLQSPPLAVLKYSALLGKPTRYSVSHVMYARLASVGAPQELYQHVRLDVEPAELGASLRAIEVLHFLGANITQPYKLAVTQHLDRIDPIARHIGAVNTVKFAGGPIGYNTDWLGITSSLKRQAAKTDFDTATIFGSGGAARAAIYSCRQLGAKRVNVFYRPSISAATKSLLRQAEALEIYPLPYPRGLPECIERSQLVINATPVGMVGNDPTPFDLVQLKGIPVNDKLYLDVVFNPNITPLLRYFRTLGAAVIDGLWMMIHQGIAALSLWLDQAIIVDDSELQDTHLLLAKTISRPPRTARR